MNYSNSCINLPATGIQNMKQTQKQTKGGFKMKPTRFLIVALVLMGLVATASAVTEEGTVISNQAT
jgi:hypothetical protein